VTIDGDEMTVLPVGENGALLPMKDRANGDQAWASGDQAQGLKRKFSAFNLRRVRLIYRTRKPKNLSLRVFIDILGGPVIILAHWQY